ncbi:hypothetical protein F4821DRAFT_18625 [Hypoxylon rubiginosum]|uniref:Uncharacterized protein n=1 Tax=Hypoxylon rubiginosum TaxID=110542 RepID=A0ACC0CMQ9_9PEZI|nr:hypothetical protein F4821DRAFT_18625 [Hypoxylon rubiginosum]
MPSLLPALQSEKVYELIRMTGALQPDDVMPLWYRYYASIDGNLDILVDDLLSFLLPGRLRRRKPWSNNSYPMPDHLPTDILETLPSELLGDIPTDSLESLPVNSLGALSLSVLDDRPISLWNDRPGSASDDPPISIPDDRLASMTDDPPISLPDDMPKPIGEVLWGVAFDSVSSLSSRDRMPVLNLIAYRLAAGIRDNPAIRDDLELMLQSPSLPYVMQIESRRRLALDAGRWSRPFNLVSMWHLGAGLESCSFQNQASDRTQVALLILEIVWMMTGSQACFDPRDRVFGTFGFFGETLPSEFALSHKMSLEELYSTFCQYLLTESASYPHVELTRWWSTLHRATLAGKRSSLPSWCPDFHQEVDDRYQPFGGAVSSYGIFCQPRFEAGTQLPIMIKRGKDWSEIMLRGRVFDSVSAVHSAIPCVPNLKKVSSGIMGFGTLRMSIYRLAIWERDLAARVVEAPVGSIKPSDMFEVYWQTLVGNRLSGFGSFPSITRQDFLDFQTGLQRIRDLFDRVGVIKRLEDGTLVEEENLWGPSTPEEEDIYQFMTSMESSPYYSVSQAMNHALWDNRPFTTTSGRFGYGRKSMEEGDILCIFDGSTTAHLIRRKKKGRPGAEVYQLVGEAFVHGMMYGEINNLDIEEQDITLI